MHVISAAEAIEVTGGLGGTRHRRPGPVTEVVDKNPVAVDGSDVLICTVHLSRHAVDDALRPRHAGGDLHHRPTQGLPATPLTPCVGVDAQTGGSVLHEHVDDADVATHTFDVADDDDIAQVLPLAIGSLDVQHVCFRALNEAVDATRSPRRAARSALCAAADSSELLARRSSLDRVRIETRLAADGRHRNVGFREFPNGVFRRRPASSRLCKTGRDGARLDRRRHQSGDDRQ